MTNRPGPLHDQRLWPSSDSQPDRSLLDWADDYAEFVRLLGLPTCPIIGLSGGGPDELACADRKPALVTLVGLAASIGPLGEVPWCLG